MSSRHDWQLRGDTGRDDQDVEPGSTSVASVEVLVASFRGGKLQLDHVWVSIKNEWEMLFLCSAKFGAQFKKVCDVVSCHTDCMPRCPYQARSK